MAFDPPQTPSTCLPGHPEPHAGLPQHAGLPRLDGPGRGPQSRGEEGTGLGLGLHFSSQHGRAQPPGGVHAALPESHPGGQEERGGQRAPPLGRHQRPLRR